MSILGTNILAMVIILGVLIFVHEAGHFLTAKLFGVRVLVFSLGFGKRLFGFRRGGTDYRVSLVPLGGYVRMAGDTPEENQPTDPEEFLSKPKWQRLLILLAGPAMNLVTAVTIMTFLGMAGSESVNLQPIIGGVQPNGPAAKAGLQAGDRVIRVNDELMKDFDDFRGAILANAETPIRVEYLRSGQTRETTLTPMRRQDEIGTSGYAGITPFLEPVIGRVLVDTPAARAGLRAGDRILAADGKTIANLFDMGEILDKAKTRAVPMQIDRGGQTLAITLPGEAVPSGGYRGFGPPIVVRKLAFGPALREGASECQRMAKYIFAGLGKLVRGRSRMDEWAGPIGIARISGVMLRTSWKSFLALMALISVNLGILNLLPIPVLDGGHIMIILVEGAARRDLSIATKERVQQVGFAVIALLMIVVLYNDIVTHIFSALRS